MSLFEEWKKDVKEIYFEYNYFIEPRFKIIDFKVIDKSESIYYNSDGFGGTETNGIMSNWVDLELFYNKYNESYLNPYWSNNLHPYDSISDIIEKAFEYNKYDYIKKIRKMKLDNLYTK